MNLLVRRFCLRDTCILTCLDIFEKHVKYLGLDPADSNQLKDDLSPSECLRNKVLEQTDRAVLAQEDEDGHPVAFFKTHFANLSLH